VTAPGEKIGYQLYIRGYYTDQFNVATRMIKNMRETPGARGSSAVVLVWAPEGSPVKFHALSVTSSSSDKIIAMDHEGAGSCVIIPEESFVQLMICDVVALQSGEELKANPDYTSAIWSVAQVCEAVSFANDQLHQQPQRSFRILVVGECGDGKSTLINNLLGLQGERAAAAGRSERGLTKMITAYGSDKYIGDKQLVVLDSPGVGDQDVSAMTLLSLIEENLAARDDDDALDGVIVTSPVTDGRVKLGAQVVQTLVDKGFIGKDRWQNVILVGTKMDRGEPDDHDFFLTRIKDNFFASAGDDKRGMAVLTGKTDVSQLWHAIEALPSTKVAYEKPDAQIMSEALAHKLGINEKVFQENLMEERQKAEAAVAEAEQARQDAAKAEELVRLAQEEVVRVKAALAANEEAQRQDELRRLEEQRLDEKAKMAFDVVSSECEEVYSADGTGARQNLSVWRPRVRPDQYRIMYLASNSRSMTSRVCCVQDPGVDALRPPSHFECVWTDAWTGTVQAFRASLQGPDKFTKALTGAATDGQLWKAIPPPGYVALSDVAVHGSNSGLSPGVTRPAEAVDPHFRCVHMSLVKTTLLGRKIWTDAGSGGTYDGACWSINDSDGFRVSRGGNHPPPMQQYTLTC